ncbi:hypothetical protein IJ21_27120 [Paenibacillus sp. 32O-W]|uniref:DUF6179 domain-containing protein n=1 Tax=Paenibacillus sp. 32O-W TaxID=1695218 RepID=UPI0007207C46|nr:DUF6179 domain-containing protein [Paenibacillus sp. 32O-W]ALS28108.1 hypothetical protein IJ21_27120 [Paenibacillus sp. 32O-W]
MKPDRYGHAANGNQTPATRGKINPSSLKRNPYTLSLLNEGQRAGLLNDREIYRIQNQLLLILQNVIRRYTQGESSSVTAETAESMLASILYAADAYLLSLEDHDKAIACLKTADIAKLYEQGVERVRQCFDETKRLYDEVRQQKLDVPVEAYNTTIEESLPLFLKKYGIIFEAQNTMASIDYPLAVDDMRLQGVFYMKQYLERLQIENRFCLKFNQEDLLRLLKNFGSVCRFDYRIELFNIFELVFHHALFSILSGGGANQVRISSYQFEQLKRMFACADASAIDTMIHEAMHRLQHSLQISDPKSIDYMNQLKTDLVRRIVNAAEHHNLHAVIVTDREEKIKPVVLSFNAEDRMSDVRLRRLLDEIVRSETKEEKVRLIRSNFFSLHDYLDMLESDCLYGDEYEALYASFGDIELAILAKIVFYEELRSDSSDLAAIISRKKDAEPEWQKHLITFMKGLSAPRIRAIDTLIGNMDYEEIRFY